MLCSVAVACGARINIVMGMIADCKRESGIRCDHSMTVEFLPLTISARRIISYLRQRREQIVTRGHIK